MYPGQFPNVKLNLFNIVLVVDLSQTSSINFIAGAVNMIIQRGFPFRFGVVPLVETEQGESFFASILSASKLYDRCPDGETFLLAHRARWSNEGHVPFLKGRCPYIMC